MMDMRRKAGCKAQHFGEVNRRWRMKGLQAGREKYS